MLFRPASGKNPIIPVRRIVDFVVCFIQPGWLSLHDDKKPLYAIG